MSNKKPNHLDEVRSAAKYNYFRHLREQEEINRMKDAVREGNLDELVEKELAERQAALAQSVADDESDVDPELEQDVEDEVDTDPATDSSENGE
jgi:hypothetical protein